MQADLYPKVKENLAKMYPGIKILIPITGNSSTLHKAEYYPRYQNNFFQFSFNFNARTQRIRKGSNVINRAG